MNPYVIYTDSACDLPADFLEELGVKTQSLSFRFDGSEREYLNNDLKAEDFYAEMRNGKVAKTAAVNTDAFKTVFEKEVAAGNDLLYLGFSSGLSTTYNSGRLACEELSEAYPDRKLLSVDTLCASAGQGLLVYLAVKKKSEGATVEEVASYVESIKLNLCHWFTVDDLVYLKRGGRVSSAVALVGGMLNIKPVMHVDNEGHLIKTGTVRGRKNSLKALADKYETLSLDPQGSVIFISHGDCLDDAHELAAMLKEKGAPDVRLITHVGPVIGAHSGPGTMALFFLGKER
ncbi:MAG: DegV family protein [Ruminococcaceae bacterium]|nr:DegV family protein [Oscillospiraceae bacterium]